MKSTRTGGSLFEPKGAPKCRGCGTRRQGAGAEGRDAQARGGRCADRPEDVWSITCFFAKRDSRKQGITRSLIEAAVEHARAKGAKVVEAHPVDPDSPSYRFMGFVLSLRGSRFPASRPHRLRRHVMRLELG